MAVTTIDISKNLYTILTEFDGAHGDNEEERIKSLEASFLQIAGKLLYGGYIRVRDDYAVFISKVEFYYHEEDEIPGKSVNDSIVYHRDGRFINRQVPYFPVMSLHSHWSGFDITFENESSHYRASALIREFVILDLRLRKFVELKTSGKDIVRPEQTSAYRPVGKVVMHDNPVIDNRSTYLQYFLNGFEMVGHNSSIKWQDVNIPMCMEPKKEYRKNADEHDWGYTFQGKQEYFAAIRHMVEDQPASVTDKGWMV